MKNKLSFAGFLLIIVIVFSISCRKPDPPKAVVTVVDTAGLRTQGVKVIVYADPNGSYIDPQEKTINATEYTDGTGEAHFTFKNKAIFTVKAEQYTPPYHRDGKKLLVLKEDETVSITIIIK